jgi:hypothetical protein
MTGETRLLTAEKQVSRQVFKAGTCFSTAVNVVSPKNVAGGRNYIFMSQVD